MKHIHLPWRKTELASEAKDRAHTPLIAIAFPLIVESILRVSLSSVDIFMLSSFSEEAVAAIGFVGQFTFFIMILHDVIAIGTSIVIAQYIGSKRFEEAKEVSRAGIAMVSIVGVSLSILFTISARAILSLYTLDAAVLQYATEYFLIYAACSVFSAFAIMQSAILRSYGYTKDTMLINIISNVINIIGNALSLYGFFGLPVFGVVGVAISTVFSQLCASVMMTFRITQIKEVRFSLKQIWVINRTYAEKILKIGLPTAGENLSYNISQIIIMSIITTFGTFAMSAFTYMTTILRFAYTVSAAIGTSVQIKTGYFVGASLKEEAYKRVFGYQAVGTVVSMLIVSGIILLKEPIISFFTQEASIKNIMISLMPIAFALETARSVNLITIPALKGAGDVQFPVIVGVFSMWLLSVLGGYILSVPLALGLTGIFIMMASDEAVRAVIFLFRWKSKRWMKKDILN